MSDENLSVPETVEAAPEATSAEFAPQWGTAAPRGGKTVVNRALKDGARVPLFLGQTLINSLRDLGYNSTTSALCEHVDNAFQWGASEVRVYFRQTGKQPHQKIDILVYDNGQGMAPHVLKVAMAFGGSMVYDNRSGIGRYGMGMKAAALNVARSVDVYSWQEPKAYYSMTLDVEKIGQDRNNMIELPDPQLSDEMPSDIVSVLTKPMDYPKSRAGEDTGLLAGDSDELAEKLGQSGTLVFMPNCDRLTYSTSRGLVDHAVREMARIYRRFLADGKKLYVNNRRVEPFDPTFWMAAARHTTVEGLTETKSQLVDSWTVHVPVAEASQKTTYVKVRVYMLPVAAWSILPRDVLKNRLHVFEDHAVSFMRNDREVEIGWEPRLKLRKHQTMIWCRVEIDFNGEADAGFGVAANKQGVRLQEYVAKLILDRLEPNISKMRTMISETRAKLSVTAQAGQASEAERAANEMESIQQVALPKPPADTVEEKAALEANLRGLATSLRGENETEEQAFARVTQSKYLTDLKHMEYAPFYDTEYKYGKLILRLNTAHPFYQKVWQPLGDLVRKAVPAAGAAVGDELEGVGPELAETARKAQFGLQLVLLSLARAQAQMVTGDASGDLALMFRNLRKAWSDVLETQFHQV